MPHEQTCEDHQPKSFVRDYYQDYVLRDNPINIARSRQRVRTVLTMLGETRGRVLSIGAGNLTEATEFLRTGFDVTIADVVDTQFERAQTMGITTHRVDLDRDDIPGQYDVVSSLEVLEHLVDPLGALRKLVLATVPGGRLFVSLPEEFHIVSRVEILLGRPRFSRYDWHHLRFFTLRSARELFEAAGVKVLQVRHIPLIPPRWPSFVRPLGRALARIAPSLLSLSHVFELKPEPPERGASG